MELPRYDIPGLLVSPASEIEDAYDIDANEAMADLERRMIGGLPWEVCIVQQHHGMLLLQPGDNIHPIKGLRYRRPSCGNDRAESHATARMLVVLGVQTPMGELLRGIVARYTHFFVPDLSAEPPIVEVPRG